MFELLIEKYLGERFDSICLDMSGHPVKLRHNVFEPIDIKEIAQEVKQNKLMARILARKGTKNDS